MIITGLNSSQNFGKALVVLSKKSLGEHIANTIVTPFNKNLLKLTEQPGDSFVYDKYKDNTDFWILATRSGLHHFCSPLIEAFTYMTGIPTCKISFPIKMDDGNEIHLLDWAMATAAPFAKDNKIEYIIAEKPSGSFGDIVNYNKKMIEMGADIKDTIVCLGNSAFDVKPRELNKFMLDTIKNPQKAIGLVGVEKSPKEVANCFTVFSLMPNRETPKNNIFSFSDFVEHPYLVQAKKLALPNGNCVANTGMFVIKKEAMKALLDEIKVNPDVIKKNDMESYDFMKACKWVQAKYGADACDVKVVKNWNAISDSFELYSFLNKIKQGHYLSEFGKYGEMIKNSLSKRFNFDEKTGKVEFLISDRWNSLDEIPEKIKAETYPRIDFPNNKTISAKLF